MGMFDYITTEFGPDELKGIHFQTKDTPEQYLKHYRITVDGLLEFKNGESWEACFFTGSVYFYERPHELTAFFVGGKIALFIAYQPERKVIFSRVVTDDDFLRIEQ